MLNLCELIMAQVKCVEVFKDFYQTKTKHRKLTWIYSLGTCNINGKFEQKTMELVVTTYQVNPQVPYCSFLRVKIAAFSHPPPKNPLLTSFDRCFQASALLLFNASDRLTYSEIMSQLNLTDDDVVRLLHSLSCAKYKILNKEPSSKTISSTDTFEFNSKFTDKMRRIKVPSLLRSLLPLLWRLFIYPLRTKIIKKLKIQTADPAPSR